MAQTTNQKSGWQIGKTRPLVTLPYFNLCAHEVVTPQGHRAEYFYMECGDWIKVVPVTSAAELVLVNQYRPVNDLVSLEVPGGIVDPGDRDPCAAARRELLEETGYTAELFEPLGWFYPNPGTFSCKCWVFLAKNATPSTVQQLDPGEEMSVELVPLKSLPEILESGRIKHSLVIAALTRYLLAQSNSKS